MASSDFTAPASPSPSPSPFSHSSSPSWHFPGPSSRYHQRERPKYTRFARSTYTPVAPVLSTERRAHRRAQSAAQVSQVTLIPPPSEKSSRSPLSRFPSYTTTSTSTSYAMAGPAFMTPAKERPSQHMDMRLQDSPFSDYFSDDARSVSLDNNSAIGGALYDAPSSETQQLLVRLNKLQAHLMRAGEDEREVLNIVGRKLGEVDSEIEALHSQTRLPADMDDSGLFMDDEIEERNEGTPDARPGSGSSSPGQERAFDVPESVVTPENTTAELDYQLLEAQRVLESVTKAQEELRKRHTELAEINRNHVQQIEEREQEVQQLRSENEVLKSDLGLDQSELLFLKLQMKALEVGSDGVDNTSELAHISEEGRAGIKRVKRGRIPQEMRHWHRDWHDVDARLRRRRSKYGVPSANGCDHNPEQDLSTSEETEPEGDWQLETTRDVHGRVSSIAIQRGEKRYPPVGLDGATDEEELQQPRQTEGAQRQEYAEQSSQTEGPRRMERTDQGCQTDFTLPPACSLDEVTTGTADGYATELDDDDCAITTSASTAESSPVIQPLSKSAWTELWEGLGQLAGVGDEPVS